MNNLPGDAFAGISIGTAARRAEAELRRAGVDSPRLTAEILMSYVLGWDRVRILSHGDEWLPADAGAAFAAAVTRRIAGEPLQYITGVQEFYGLAFRVTASVLIPRPETEVLVEKAILLARGMVASSIRFVDVGTGSGCIAAAFAHSETRALGWAADLSAEALKVARGNVLRHGVSNRVQLVQSDLLECFPRSGTFDFVLSNPPYVSRQDTESLPPLVRDHEPHLALFAGDSGLDIYRRLIPQAAGRLALGGYLLLEIGQGMSERVVAMMESAGLSLQSLEKDLQAIPRCAVARRMHG
jgi:release factor glutamine methyltransferase